VALAPGRSARVRFILAPRALSHWDDATGSWQIAPGCYRVMLGSSSRDTPLRARLPIAGGRC
jgi:beta-glucosidase